MPRDPEITPELIQKHGITPEEYERIRGILKRDPTFTELGIFSVMWSEHCSYKNSRLELRKFPTSGGGILVKAGEENAGVVDIGDGWAIAFKIESHNHPSAVEPFQGAATGVGGIIRDIFTMGARPVLCMDSLRFGPLSAGPDGTTEDLAKRNRRLLAGVVAGIAHYGNCIGLPTVGGEIAFDACYSGNPLVNVVCLGALRHDQIRKGRATGAGNPVYYVGAATGRDGLAGAAFASRELTEESKEDRPAVQVGDPFMEKLLLEACLELFAHPEAVVGVQDMGAAGLTCSTCETASRGHSGIEIELDLVPQREPGMSAYETMLSESQERMLIIARKGHEKEVERIFEKWDLHASRIGEVTSDGFMRVKKGGRVVAEIPARPLADEAPLYAREAQVPAPVPGLNLRDLPEPEDLGAELEDLLADPTLASKNWVWRQYDHQVRAGTCVLPGSDAAVVRLLLDELAPGFGSTPQTSNATPRISPVKYLAIASDCNGAHCRIHPRQGAKMAVAEACRNLVCSGAHPLAATDNLNFGNPHKPENFWRLRECVEGMAEACRFFGTPITGGNVSLYNESPEGAVDPTPVYCAVGLIEDEKHITTQEFKGAGDKVFLVGDLGQGLGGSLYAIRKLAKKVGPLPPFDFESEKRVQDAVLAAIRAGLVRSAHDCSEGGLAVALVESCVSGEAPVGGSFRLPAHARADEILFNEAPSRIVVSVAEGQAEAFAKLCAEHGAPCLEIGTTGGAEFSVTLGGREAIRRPVASLRAAWHDSLAKRMED
ncbi:MAG: phosphoribosylformylglycinamidine synthase subunit PurL [Verrucomicrobiae bacterium]|nr:phosphoribosylformylglycinamidine synthase subunit PurL [Verrucomicrobiae bacterium]